MRVERDFEDLLSCLNRYDVRYCVVGSFALAFHAMPRYTKDMDILVDSSCGNAERLLLALNEFGFSSLNLHAKDFTVPGQIVQLGYEPVRVDLISSLPGLEFEDVWQHRETGSYGGTTAHFIGLRHLILAKERAGRPQDIADLKKLRAALAAQPAEKPAPAPTGRRPKRRA